MVKQSKGKAPLKSLMLMFLQVNPTLFKVADFFYIGSAMVFCIPERNCDTQPLVTFAKKFRSGTDTPT